MSLYETLYTFGIPVVSVVVFIVASYRNQLELKRRGYTCRLLPFVSEPFLRLPFSILVGMTWPVCVVVYCIYLIGAAFTLVVEKACDKVITIVDMVEKMEEEGR